MTAISPALYDGVVVHRRLAPVLHELRYRVAYMLLDLERLDETAAGLRLFSHNRFNLFALHDRDHGRGDGSPLIGQARQLLAEAGLGEGIDRIFLLTMPRLLGYVFNPLSIYYALGRDGEVRALIYEVSNTFGGRRSYVLPVREAGGARFRQSCAKALHVSPFNAAEGCYGFVGIPPGERVRLSIDYAQGNATVMTAHLTAIRQPLDDRQLARTFLRHPALTWKVIAGIHWEALRLWLKGVPVAARTAGGR
jgi:uncharacterized protein